MSFLDQEYRKMPPAQSAEELLARGIREGADSDPNFGYAYAAPRSPLPARPVAEIAPHILDQEPQDTILWPYLFQQFPDWHWGRQPTGDCTRWMKQHELDVLYACLYAAGSIEAPRAQVAGESIYGLAKCELVDSYRYHGPGATGWAIGKAVLDYGHLWRQKYEIATQVEGRFGRGRRREDSGQSTWDLTSETDYSVSWGDRGRGLPDALEPYAAENRSGDLLEVGSPEEAGKLIQAGYPADYCGYTYWAHDRGEDGIGTRFEAGWHAITATGVRWDDDGQVLALWIANTGHGNHCSGPVGPFPVPDVYAQCGAWVPRKLLAPVYSAGDCYAHTVIGTPIQPLPPWTRLWTGSEQETMKRIIIAMCVAAIYAAPCAAQRTTTTYRGIAVRTPAPYGEAGEALQANFKALADRLGNHVEAADDPTADDDSAGTGGEDVCMYLSTWRNTADNGVWICLDASEGAACGWS